MPDSSQVLFDNRENSVMVRSNTIVGDRAHPRGMVNSSRHNWFIQMHANLIKSEIKIQKVYTNVMVLPNTLWVFLDLV